MPAKTVHFDIKDGGDGQLDLEGKMEAEGSEMNEIIEKCKTEDDYNVFLVSNPSKDVRGWGQCPGKYAFVFVSSPTTLAHELGHTEGKLNDEPKDTENIMSYVFVPGDESRWRLRYNQWDWCNKKGKPW